MEVRILDAMRTCKQEIEDKALQYRCISRLDKMRTIVGKHQRTLDPYDPRVLAEDICRLPDIREVIIDGTDEKFDACAEEVTSGLPKLASQILEERTTKISALLPLTERSDKGFSLATAWVKCGSCGGSAMDATDALSHYRSMLRIYRSGKSIGEVTLDTYVGRRAGAAKPPSLNSQRLPRVLFES